LKNKNLFRPPLHFFGLKSEGVFFIPYCSLKNYRQRLACESHNRSHIQRLKYVSCSAAETGSDIGKHAKTACGHFLLVKMMASKAMSDKCLTKKQSVVDCFART
jgi:hypothetical protein